MAVASAIDPVGPAWSGALRLGGSAVEIRSPGERISESVGRGWRRFACIGSRGSAGTLWRSPAGAERDAGSAVRTLWRWPRCSISGSTWWRSLPRIVPGRAHRARPGSSWRRPARRDGWKFAHQVSGFPRVLAAARQLFPDRSTGSWDRLGRCGGCGDRIGVLDRGEWNFYDRHAVAVATTGTWRSNGCRLVNAMSWRSLPRSTRPGPRPARIQWAPSGPVGGWKSAHQVSGFPKVLAAARQLFPSRSTGSWDRLARCGGCGDRNVVLDRGAGSGGTLWRSRRPERDGPPARAHRRGPTGT